MRKKLRGSMYLLLATFIWGTTFVAQSVGMDYVGPFTFQAARCFLAVLSLLPVILISDRFKGSEKSFFARWRDKKLWIAGLLCGIPLFFACNLQQVGLMDTDAGKSAFLTAMYIVFVPLIEIFQKKKPSKLIPISVVLAVAGLYCLSCMGVANVSRGDLLLLCCALMFSVQILCVAHFAPQVDALRLNLVQALICSLLSAVVMLFTEQPTWRAVADCWLPIGYAGLLSMGAAYSLQILGQKHLDSAPASLIMSLESVFAVLGGWIILKETMTGAEALGCVLMFAAVILSQLPVKEKKSVVS